MNQHCIEGTGSSAMCVLFQANTHFTPIRYIIISYASTVCSVKDYKKQHSTLTQRLKIMISHLFSHQKLVF